MNYPATAKKAAAMLRKNGVSMVLRVTTPGAYDPATGTTSGDVVTEYACVGLRQKTGYKDSGLGFQGDTRILATDEAVLLAADGLAVTPKPSDVLRIDGVDWNVLLTQTTRPGGVDLLHKCFIRKA